MEETDSQVLPSSVYVSPEDIPVRDVARLMTARGIGAIVVVNGQKQPVGMVTDRDILVRVMAPGLDAAEVPVGSVMSAPLVTIGQQETIEAGIAAMNRHGIRRLPIVDNTGCLVSLLTLDDIIRHKLADGADLSGIVRDRSLRLEPEARVRPEPVAAEPEAPEDSPPVVENKTSPFDTGLEFKPGVTPEESAGLASPKSVSLAKPSVVVPMVKRRRTLIDEARYRIFGGRSRGSSR